MDRQVTIVGGGSVGLLLALAIAPYANQITLIEQQAIETTCRDQRAIALSHSSVSLLDGLGIWSQIAGFAKPIEHVHVTQQSRWGVATLHAHELGLPFLGQVVPLGQIVEAAKAQLKKWHNVTYQSPATVEQIAQQSNGHWQLFVTDHQGNGHWQPSDLIVAADGAGSRIRRELDIRTHVHDYGQSALVFPVKHSQPMDGWAYERFTESGALAILPAFDHDCQSTAIWTVPHNQAKPLQNLATPALAQTLQATFGDWLGWLDCPESPKQFPLSLVHAKQLSQNNCLLFGNAAHFLHPIAGQGLNLSLRDIGQLHDCLSQQDAFDHIPETLKRYAQARQQDHQLTVTMTDQLMRNALIRRFKSIGLVGLQRNRLANRLISQLMLGHWTPGNTLIKTRVKK